jgi:phenylpyruvate tautomerase PptA (4-oxalocrotonate tautomerase family)
MAQIKIFGRAAHLRPIRQQLSEVIHNSVMEAFQLPVDKRFHRFFCLEEEDFIFPPDRTNKYTILEISIFEGRTVEAKKKLIRLLFERLEKELAIQKNDVEITFFETPKHNWGIRGVPGDELQLNYKVEV